MSFEKYLIEKGYTPYKKDKNLNYVKIKDTSIGVYSSMADVCHFYKNGDKEVIIGLNEYKHPPILIYPRPNGVVFREEDQIDNTTIQDWNMSAIFQNFSYDEIYEAMFDKSIKLELNLKK